MIVSSNSADLLSATSKSADSPFTIGLEKARWSGAGNLINAVTLLSSINSESIIPVAASALKPKLVVPLISLARLQNAASL